MKKKDKKNSPEVNEPIVLDIPEEEIWTYQIEGLSAPKVNQGNAVKTKYKVLVVAVILISIFLSIFFSFRALHSEIYDYNETEDGVELVKFSNTGEIKELNVDYEYDEDLKPITSKPITSIHEYAFNCDDQLNTITIGKDVTKIDGKSFYSVWNLQNIYVDEENPAYCDVDGVLFNKDCTELICYPIDHDAYLRQKSDTFKDERWVWDDNYTTEYMDAIQTYKIPSTVKKIGELAFNYTNLVVVYFPEGLETIETLAFFKSEQLSKLYTYNGDKVYRSFPDSLTFIGSDAFSYDKCLTYIYIPANVKTIGHHAFWDAVYKEGGGLKGVTEMNIALSEEQFNTDVETGGSWLPEYTNKLFNKKVPVNYSAERLEMDK